MLQPEGPGKSGYLLCGSLRQPMVQNGSKQKLFGAIVQFISVVCYVYQGVSYETMSNTISLVHHHHLLSAL